MTEPTTLTVADLRTHLATLPDDYEVWVDTDDDGDGVSVARPVVFVDPDVTLREVHLAALSHD